MKYSNLVFTIFIILILTLSGFSQGRMFGKVVDVIDGRTVLIEAENGPKIKIRLQFIEVPEAEQKLHKIVKDHLKKLTLNKNVIFEPKSILKADTVGQVFVEGFDLSEQMIRDGAAWYSVPEKNSQDEFERSSYQANEAQAKKEKRGVWSIKNLKPAWEFRAEQERLRKATEEKRLAEEKQRRKEAQKKRIKQSSVFKAEGSSGKLAIENWGEITKFGLQKVAGYEDLFKRYDSIWKTQFLYTSVDTSVMKAGKKWFVFGGRAGYFHRLNLTEKNSKGYFLILLAKQNNTVFSRLKIENLIIYADKKKFVLEKPVKGTHQKFFYQEILLFFLEKDQLETLSKAKSVRYKLGGFSGVVGKKYKKMMRELLKATK